MHMYGKEIQVYVIKKREGTYEEKQEQGGGKTGNNKDFMGDKIRIWMRRYGM